MESVFDALALPRASPAEALLARDKDAAYVQRLVDQSFAALSLCGGARAHRWRPEVRAAATLAYYGLTTGRGRPTPGEQHCDVSLVHSPARLPAGTARRALAVALLVLLPYCFDRLCSRLLAAARQCEDSDQWLLQAVAPRLRAIASAGLELHAALFLLHGRFLHAAHRLLSLEYVRHSRFALPRASYAPLGLLMLGRMALSGTAALQRALLLRSQEQAQIQAHADAAAAAAASCGASSSSSSSSSRSSSGANGGGGGGNVLIQADGGIVESGASGSEATTVEARTCSLCLSPRRSPAATPCGHIFCWACVHEWLADNDACPLCRTAMTPQSVRCLHAYA